MSSGSFLVPALLLLLALNACSTTPSYNPVGYIYDATTDERSLVFNIRTHWMSFQGKRSADVGSSSEFGAGFHDCSNSSYHCLSGPLNIVIPVTINSYQWKYNGVSCMVILKKSVSNYEISCTDTDGRETYVDYSSMHGILTIRKIKDGDRTKFVLRGDYGIFGIIGNLAD